MTGLLWRTTNGGPTGDGVNEIIFTQGNIGGGGVTSMIMNPVRGNIIECDVILGMNGPNQWPPRTNMPPGCPSIQPCLAGGPGWTTAIPHEIGHFFGLDHTNLHPGHAPGGADACTPTNGPGNVAPVNGAPASLVSLPLFTEYPEMVGSISWVGYWRCDPNKNISGHADEASGMAEIYPVTSPDPQGTNPQRLPAINTHGRIEGSVIYNAQPGTTQPVFGANVLPTRLGSLIVPTGKVSGTGRLTPNIGVVGARDTQSLTSTSGEFRIHRVGTDKPLRMVVEPLDSLGLSSNVNVAPFVQSEWFYDPTYNPIKNPMSPPMLQHSLLPNGAFLPVYSGGGTFGVPGSPSLGSLYVAPGTVLQLTLNMSNGLNVLEPVSRPVIMIDQRSGRPVPFSAGQVVIATVVHDYELDVTTGLWTTGGAPFAAGTVSTNQPPTPSAPGPWTTTWTTTLGALGIGATGAVTVRFSASEFPTTPGNGGRPPSGTTAVVGINEVVF